MSIVELFCHVDDFCNALASCLRWADQTWQGGDGLVLWLQAARGVQRSGRVAGFPAHSRRCLCLKALLRLAKHLFANLFGDKGYLSAALFRSLCETYGVQLVARLKRGMKSPIMLLADKLLLCTRAIVGIIIDQLKRISQIERAPHRNPVNFLINLVCSLIVYCHRPAKPSLGLNLRLGLPAA